MLSQQGVYGQLAEHFVGLRFDWEQGNHYKDKFGFILGTGDQLFLDAKGNRIATGKRDEEGKTVVLYGRHGCDTTPTVVSNIVREYAIGNAKERLKMDWFWWPSKPSKRPSGTYPVSYGAIAGYARLPIAIVDGPISKALEDSKFLAWHVRQFVWVRGNSEGEGRIRIQRVKDGLKPGLATELASLDPAALSFEALGKELDRAWLAYMKDRPLNARGYLENPHGSWMRSVKDQIISEELEIRRRASAGTLLPPGRKAGQTAPYSAKQAAIR